MRCTAFSRNARPSGMAAHDALMERAGWPAIRYDGQLLMSHQDALLMGGKVQAAPGYPDHVRFIDAALLRDLQRAHLRGSLFRPGDHAR